MKTGTPTPRPKFGGVPARVIRADERLKERGYDGLYYPGECACLADDLYPCGQRSIECKPGVRVECDCGEHNFHITGDIRPARAIRARAKE